MKIVLLGRYNPSEKLTGPEKFAKRIYSNYLKKKVNCEFIEYFFDGKKYSFFKKLFGRETNNYFGIEVTKLGLIPLFFHLLKVRPQLIHLVTYERFQVVAFIYSFFVKTKILFSIHGIVKYENSVLVERNVPLGLKIKDKLFEGFFIKSASFLHIGSEAYKNILAKYYKIKKEKIIVIPCGVDEYIIRNNARRFHRGESRLGIVFVGDSVRAEKGFKFLLSLYDRLREHFEVFIIGENFYIDKSLYLDFNFVDKMTFDKYNSFLSGKDIILSCSFYDTFNIAVFEAVAAGLYPVVTNETGVSELFAKHDIGKFFDYGDRETLMSILQELNTNRDLLDGTKDLTFIRHYRWEEVSILLFKIYNNIIKNVEYKYKS